MIIGTSLGLVRAEGHRRLAELRFLSLDLLDPLHKRLPDAKLAPKVPGVYVFANWVIQLQSG
jgi:hypothetical protein